MRDETFSDDDSADPTPLDRRLRAIASGPIPDDLRDRCLATIPDPEGHFSLGQKRPARWRARLTAAAAAVLLIGAIGLLARPRHADAANLLKAVEAAWTKVPASHSVLLIRRSGDMRREETWFVRDKGRREEVRNDHELTAVFVRNRRWDFRWDVRGRIVAAWFNRAGHGSSLAREGWTRPGQRGPAPMGRGASRRDPRRAGHNRRPPDPKDRTAMARSSEWRSRAEGGDDLVRSRLASPGETSRRVRRWPVDRDPDRLSRARCRRRRPLHIPTASGRLDRDQRPRPGAAGLFRRPAAGGRSEPEHS